MPKNKLFIDISLAVVLALSVSLIFVHRSRLYTAYLQGELAKIQAIEPQVVVDWRDSGFKTELMLDSTGREVRLLQEALATDPEIYPEGVVSGYFGGATKAAVRRFQEKYNLEITGTLNGESRKVLNGIFFFELCPKQAVEYPDMTYFAIGRDNGLPEDYVPPRLVNISSSVRTVGTVCVSEKAVQSLISLMNEARAAGHELAVTSGFRHPSVQRLLYEHWWSLIGVSAFDEIALPGFSEHQLGTALDFSSKSVGFEKVSARFGGSPEGEWLEDNAYRFGFVLSFPPGKKAITGFRYESWHYRYVGVEAAAAVRTRGITLYEYMSAQNKSEGAPEIKRGVSAPTLGAYSMAAAYYEPGKPLKILVSRRAEQRMPVASVTKLMTALVAVKHLKNDVIEVGRVAGKSNGEKLYLGENFRRDELLKLLLIESNNDAAEALAGASGYSRFISLMNSQASEIGMKNSVFVNPTGLDGISERDINHSTASDLIKLLIYIRENHPELLEFSDITDYTALKADGTSHHKLSSTNKLLMDSGFPLKIVGGKTGETLKAEKNLVLLTSSPRPNVWLVLVILGSSDHFADMKTLAHWIESSFRW